MKKIILYYFLLLILVSKISAQETDVSKPFYQLKEEKEAYFREKVLLEGPEALEGEGSEYHEYQRWLKFWEPRISPNGSYADYANAIDDYYARMSDGGAGRTFGNIDPWKELGPFNEPNHGIYYLGGGELGVGIIHDMVFNRQNADKILGWSLAGGLFYTNNKGVSWVNAGSDNWNRSGCSYAAFAPNNQTTWYAASNVGGSYYSNSLGTMGGILRTTDAGATWQTIGQTSSFPPSNQFAIVTKLLIDPTNPSIAYVSTRDGLFRGDNVDNSNISLITWTLINSGWVEDMEFKTDNTGTLIISKKVSNVWTIEYTTDNGASWTVLPTPPAVGDPTDLLAIEVSDAAPNTLYMLHKTTNYYNHQLFSFDFPSFAWSSSISTNTGQTGGIGFCVSNFNPNIIYLSAGINFKRSTDGGVTFTYHYYNPTNFKYHVDVDKIITPPASCTMCASEVYLGTHGGVSYSNDNCLTMVTRSNGLALGNGSASNSATNPEKMMIGLDHDGTVLSSGSYSSTPSLAWETVYGGDGMPPLIDYSNPSFAWAAAQMAPHQLSSNGGSSGYTPTSFAANNAFAPFIFQNQVYPEITYAASKVVSGMYTYEEIFRADNRGLGTPQQISDFANLNLVANPWPDNVVRNHWIFAGIYPTIDGNTMYSSIGINGAPWYGKLYRNNNVLNPNSTTVKNSWVEMPLPPGKNSFSYFAVDVSNPNIVYIGYNVAFWIAPELYRVDYTIPGFPVFQNIAGNVNAGGLPIGVINLITEKGSNGGIYVSNDLGVYYSNNSMLDFVNPPSSNTSQWIKLGSNLPHIPLNSMEINYVVNKLRVSTAGRGVWEHDLYCPGNLNLNLTGVQNSSIFQEAVNEITSTVVIGSSATVTYRGGTYVDLNPGFSAASVNPSYFQAFIHPCSYYGNSPGLREEENQEDDLMSNHTSSLKNETLDAKIFPNPGSGLFTIELESESNAVIKVYDAMGKEVKVLRQEGIQTSLNLTGYNKGLYLVHIVIEDKVVIKKIIIE